MSSGFFDSYDAEEEFEPNRRKAGIGASNAKKIDYMKKMNFVASKKNDTPQKQQQQQEKVTVTPAKPLAATKKMTPAKHEKEDDDVILEEEDLSLGAQKLQSSAPKKIFVIPDNDEQEQEEQQEEQQQQDANLPPLTRKRFEIIPSKTGDDAEAKRQKLAPKEEPKENPIQKDVEFGGFLDSNVGKNIVNMMLNMGYNFKSGLGKGGLGMVNPIKVVPAGKVARMVSDYHDASKPKQAKDEKKDQQQRWKKNYQESEYIQQSKPQKKKKVQYVTETKTAQAPKQVLEIIDMTGEQQRVIKDMNEISQQGQQRAVSKIFPELQHNMQELVRISGDAYQDIDQKIKTETDKLAAFRRQKEKVEHVVSNQKQKIDTLQKILSIVTQCFEQCKDGSMSLMELWETFDALNVKFPDMYATYQLSKFAVSIAAPLIRVQLKDWNPLTPMRKQAPKMELVRNWKRLLHVSTEESNEFTLLLQETIVPIIRSSMLNEWDVKNPDIAVEMLEAWSQVLPQEMTQQILLNIVLPKISTEIEQWDPTKELVHLWIHPWLPLMGQHFENYGIYGTIRQKLGSVMQHWNPSDESALGIVATWKDVFRPKDLDKFLQQHIIPKLNATLRQHFVINPAEQELAPFQAVMSWYETISPNMLLPIFENEFFPKWFSVLYNWLTSEPRFDEVNNWYQGWKSMFPPQLLDYQKRRLHKLFIKGLDMINFAMSGGLVTMPTPGTTTPPRSPAREAKKLPNLAQIEDEITFKDLLEFYALENDIVFLPKHNVTYHGNQVYSFANISIYIAHDAIIAKHPTGQTWSVVSLDTLLEYAQING